MSPKQESRLRLFDRGLRMILDHASAIALIAVPAAAIVAYLAWNAEVFSLPVNLYGDQATTGLQVLRAAEWKEFLGIYSRWRWHHPGPVLAYLYAFFNSLPLPLTDFGRISLGQFLLNAACLFWALRILYELFERSVAAPLIAFLALLACLSPIGAIQYIEVWPPSAILLPFLLFMAASAGFAAGTARYLVPLMIAASIVIQSQVSTGIIVGSLSIIALILHVWHRLKERNRPGTLELLAYCGAVAVCALLWSPVIYEQFRYGSDGNLVKLFNFFTGKGLRVSSVPYAVVFIARYFHEPFAAIMPISAVAWFAGVIIALSLSLRGARKPAFFFTLFLLLAALISVASIYSARIVPGGTVDQSLGKYLSLYVYVFMAGACLAISMAVIRWIGPRRGRIATGIAAAVIVALAVLTVGSLRTARATGIEEHREIDTFVAAIAPVPGVTYELYFRAMTDDHLQWVNAVSIAYNLKKRGFDYCVHEDWKIMFGRDSLCTGKNPVVRIHCFNPRVVRVRPFPPGKSVVIGDYGIFIEGR